MHISWNSSLYTSSVLWVIHLWKDIKSMGMRLGKGGEVLIRNIFVVCEVPEQYSCFRKIYLLQII